MVSDPPHQLVDNDASYPVVPGLLAKYVEECLNRFLLVAVFCVLLDVLTTRQDKIMEQGRGAGRAAQRGHRREQTESVVSWRKKVRHYLVSSPQSPSASFCFFPHKGNNSTRTFDTRPKTSHVAPLPAHSLSPCPCPYPPVIIPSIYKYTLSPVQYLVILVTSLLSGLIPRLYGVVGRT